MFGKGKSRVQEEKIPSNSEFSDKRQTPIDTPAPLSPHIEVKRAILEVKEGLRFSQKPFVKNATVVFNSGNITEHKVEKSEIQLHRNEEGRLIDTVVIPTRNEFQESIPISYICKKYFRLFVLN
ncbi:SH3 and multiple ankyrin repeat domains protein 1 [Nephila pilipes]|uniref:SH3 and multiple ankyrin repeat domains protein 1 n=1 Tax=Nephila pilipes TaxID=299642 RepID=A0A8X6QI94_NEPPI|nr:SH3 and multiple ankyrin repeat domains protein 1 [Nephila pilipes]